jgi:hypothetical protein
MLQKSTSSFAIIHSLDGYDELSLTGDARVITNEGEQVMTPEQLGKKEWYLHPISMAVIVQRKQQKFFWIF